MRLAVGAAVHIPALASGFNCHGQGWESVHITGKELTSGGSLSNVGQEHSGAHRVV